MLIQFSVENFKSFKDEAVLSMVAASITENKDHVINKINPPLLKSAVVYGANASGKSNLVKAMQFMKGFILSSSKETQATESISFSPFRLNTETEHSPSIFEIVFIHDGIRYRYGFAVDDKKVHAEWLYFIKNVRELEVFTRDGQKFNLTSHFKSEESLVKADRIRPNALLLSVSAQFNGKIATDILKWFHQFNVISGLHPVQYGHFTIKFAKSEAGRKAVLDFLKNADVGIEDLKVTETEVDFENLPLQLKNILENKKGKVTKFNVGTFHKKFDNSGRVAGLEKFNMDDEESAGTKKIFELSGPLLNTLQKGRVLVIDELDARLHPRLIVEICTMFNSKERNSNGAQLIFVSHNTRLLDKNLFRRDQIWFLEKNKQEASELYSLVEFQVDGKKIRKDASYEKDYLRGRYGAVPMVRDLEGKYGK